MTAERDDADRQRLAALLAAFDDLRREWEDDAEGLAYQRLTWLIEATQQRTSVISRLRARVVLARWRARGMSYAELAENLGVSKQRAVQLVRAAMRHAGE